MAARHDLEPRVRFRLFCEKVDELLARRGLRDRTVSAEFSLDFTMNTDGPGGTMRTSFTLGDDEHLRSLLVAFRPFIQDDSPVFCNNILNELLRTVTDPDLREDITFAKTDWRRVQRGEVVAQHNDKVYPAAKCFDLIGNARVFHFDPVKEAEYAGLPDIVRNMLWHSMTRFVIDGTDVLDAVRVAIEAVLADGATDQAS